MPGCQWRAKAAGLRQLPSSPSVAAGLQPQTSCLPSRVGPCVEQDPLSQPGTPRLPSKPCTVDVPHPGLPVDMFLPAQLPVSPVHPEPPEADSWAAPKASCPTASPPGQLSLHVPRLGQAKAQGLQHSGGFTCSSHCLPGPYNVNTPGSARPAKEAGCRLSASPRADPIQPVGPAASGRPPPET